MDNEMHSAEKLNSLVNDATKLKQLTSQAEEYVNYGYYPDFGFTPTREGCNDRSVFKIKFDFNAHFTKGNMMEYFASISQDNQSLAATAVLEYMKKHQQEILEAIAHRFMLEAGRCYDDAKREVEEARKSIRLTDEFCEEERIK